MPRLHSRKDRRRPKQKKNGHDSTGGIKPQITAAEKAILETVLNQEAVYVDLPLNQISIDMSYQDRPRKVLVDQIATQFSEVMFGDLKVSKRPDGTYWVVDGATRKLGLESGGHPNRMVRCQIICTNGIKQEALLFKHFNCQRRAVPLANKMTAEGIACVNRLLPVVVECGFKLAGTSKNSLDGTTYLVQAYNFDEGKSLMKALFSAKAAIWDGRHRLRGRDIKALAYVYYSQPRSPDAQLRKLLCAFKQKGTGQYELDRLLQLSWNLGGSKKMNARMRPDDQPKFIAKALALEINKRTRQPAEKIDIDKLNKILFPLVEGS
jgi:hypothetical protein